MLEGSCHCGAVRIQVPDLPNELTSCNCSICRRLGMWMAYYRPAEVRILAAEGAQQAYVWGDELLAFKRCAICGCTTHWEGLDPATAHERMGINARLFDPSALEGVRIRRFDGADTWTWLD